MTGSGIRGSASATRFVLVGMWLLVGPAARAQEAVLLEWTDRLRSDDGRGVVQLYDRELQCWAGLGCRLITADFRIDCPLGAAGRIAHGSTRDGTLRFERPRWDLVHLEWTEGASVHGITLELAGNPEMPWVRRVTGWVRSVLPGSGAVVTIPLAGFDPPPGGIPGRQSSVEMRFGCAPFTVMTTSGPNE